MKLSSYKTDNVSEVSVDESMNAALIQGRKTKGNQVTPNEGEPIVARTMDH